QGLLQWVLLSMVKALPVLRMGHVNKVWCTTANEPVIRQHTQRDDLLGLEQPDELFIGRVKVRIIRVDPVEAPLSHAPALELISEPRAAALPVTAPARKDELRVLLHGQVLSLT